MFRDFGSSMIRICQVGQIGRLLQLGRAALVVIAAAGLNLLNPLNAHAEKSDKDRIAELERKVEVLTEEVEKGQAEKAVPEDKQLESVYGSGPAASKVYNIAKGLSIGGYGEVFYQNLVNDKGIGKDNAEFLRLVLYAGYKFNDKIIFNSEIEFEHASTGKDGEVSVEFATLDFLTHEAANIRGGLVLVPMGFINELHEPVTFFGNARPQTERNLIPTTWRAIGGGLFGSIGEKVDYKLFAVNSLAASGFDSSGIRGGRQSGSKATAEDFSIVARVDVSPWGGVQVGGSVYHGYTQQEIGDSVAMGAQFPLTLWEVHTQVEKFGARFRGLFTMSHLGDAATLSAINMTTISSKMLGGYVELGYNVLPLVFKETNQSLEPFYRYEYNDTQFDTPVGLPVSAKDKDVQIHTVGFSYKPIPNVVIKLDYRNKDALAILSDEINIGAGFVF